MRPSRCGNWIGAGMARSHWTTCDFRRCRALWNGAVVPKASRDRAVKGFEVRKDADAPKALRVEEPLVFKDGVDSVDLHLSARRAGVAVPADLSSRGVMPPVTLDQAVPTSPPR
jgi:hypothetical protein